MFYFAVEGGSADDDETYFASEGVREYLACGRLDETVHGRYERRKPDGSGLHAFEHLFACELFQNPRHGAYYVWMYPLKRLGEYLGRGDMAEQRDMGACREGGEHVEYETVDVAQRQHTKRPDSPSEQFPGESIGDVGGEVTHREHYPLAETGRSRSVAYCGHVFQCRSFVRYVGRQEPFRVPGVEVA